MIVRGRGELGRLELLLVELSARVTSDRVSHRRRPLWLPLCCAGVFSLLLVCLLMASSRARYALGSTRVLDGRRCGT